MQEEKEDALTEVQQALEKESELDKRKGEKPISAHEKSEKLKQINAWKVTYF